MLQQREGETMKLWHIWQHKATGYDTYSDAVVAAETEEEARLINPRGEWETEPRYASWATDPKDVQVKYLGEATEGIEKGVICSSFHAG
jgi:hypothetical protein